MKHTHDLFLLLIVLCTLASCGQRHRISKEIKKFTGTKVVLPLDSMLNLSYKNVRNSCMDSKYLYVRYVESEACSECAIRHLSEWQVLDTMKAGEGNRLNYIFILSPNKSQYPHIYYMVRSDTLFNEHIYIDMTRVFERSNPQLPKSHLLHTFLLDQDRKVKIIGSPVSNKKVMGMLKKQLDN